MSEKPMREMDLKPEIKPELIIKSEAVKREELEVLKEERERKRNG